MAASLAEEIVEAFKVPVGTPHPVRDISLVPGVAGVFDVKVNGELVFSKHKVGRHAQRGEVVEAIRQFARV